MLARTVVAAIVVFATSLVSAPLAGEQYEFRKGANCTLVMVPEDLEFEGISWTGPTIYGYTVNGPVSWTNLPLAVEADFEKEDTDDGMPVYEIRGSSRWFKLRVSDPALVENHLACEEAARQELVNDALTEAATAAFTDTVIPQDLWVDVARYAVGLGAQRLEPPVTFRGGEYLVLNIGETALYNTARLNQSNRLARTLNDLIDRVKTIDALGDFGLAGMRIDAEIPYRNFVTDSDEGVDEMMWYVGAELIPALRDFEITSQDLVDQSVVIANGTRVDVTLADQG